MKGKIKTVVCLILCLTLLCFSLNGVTARSVALAAVPTGNYSLLLTYQDGTTATVALTPDSEDANGNGIYKAQIVISASQGRTTMHAIDGADGDARVPLSTAVVTRAGTYDVTFTKAKTGTGGTTTVVRVDTTNYRYFVLGSFNNYTADLGSNKADLTYYGANRMTYNAHNLEYDEYVLQDVVVEYMDQDFYIARVDETGNTVTQVYPTSGKIKLTDDGVYNFFFTTNGDYGYDEPMRYEQKHSDPSEKTVYVTNEKEFNDFAAQCNSDIFSNNKTVILQADLDFTDKEFKQIAIFSGVFNGNGHTIKNVTLTGVGSYSGIFRYVEKGGVVKNLNVEADITATLSQSYLGGIVGSNSGLIENCTFRGAITGSTYIGGIVGVNEVVADDTTTADDNDSENGYVLNGCVRNCKNYGEVAGYGNVGGIVGLNRGTVFASANYGTINNVMYSSLREGTIVNIGGVCGYSVGDAASIWGAENHGDVGYKATGEFVGGIVGMAMSEVRECANFGKVVGSEYVGGIVGFYANVRSETTNDLLSDVYKSYIEDIFGDYERDDGTTYLPTETTDPINAELYLCFNEGDVEALDSTGGIAGYMSTTEIVNLSIYNSTNSGKIYAKNGSAGGIIGVHSSGALNSCFDTGTVDGNGKNYVGGIAGKSETQISSCFAIADVYGGSYVGGIAGEGGQISGCYANVNIFAEGEKLGSIAGNVTKAASGNYYVATDMGGIDKISYAYKAEGLTPLEMASTSMLPPKMVGLDASKFIAGSGRLYFPQIKALYACDSAFVGKEMREKSSYATILSYKIVFVGENDEVIKSIKAYYNESVSEDKIPPVPEKEGYYVSWDKFVTEKLTLDQVVRAQFVKGLTSIATDDTMRPEAFLQGLFHPDTVLSLTDMYDQNVGAFSGYTVYKNYRVSATLDGEATDVKNLKLRLYVPDTLDKVKVLLVTADGTKEAEATRSGDYYAFTLSDTDQFIVLYKPSLVDKGVALYVAVAFIGGAAVAVGVTLLVLLLKRRRRNG